GVCNSGPKAGRNYRVRDKRQQARPMARKKKVGARKKRQNSARKKKPISRASNSSLIVGIGASAGGLEAFNGFFSKMPSDSGMAFVLVQHLSPDHKSALAELIGRV